MTRPARLQHFLAAGLLVTSVGIGVMTVAGVRAQTTLDSQQTVTAVQISTFMTAEVGQPVQGLIWRGGIELQSPSDTFGGLSGITFTGADGRLVMVSDRGNFVTGQLVYDEAGRPLSLVGVRINPIPNSQGDELPRAFARDAEAIDVVVRDGLPAAVRVGFENLTRVADFPLVDGVPSGAARPISIPEWLSNTRTMQASSRSALRRPPPPSPGPRC